MRTNRSQEPDALAAQLFDEALTQASITSQEAAYCIGVSDALVRRWRLVDHRERPSFVQLLCLPPAFHLEMNRAISRRFGFGRAALAQVLEGLGDLALAVER